MSYFFGLFLGKSDKEILDMKKEKLQKIAKLQKEVEEIDAFIKEKGIKEE